MPVINLARQCFSSERRNVAYPVVSAQGSTPEVQKHPTAEDRMARANSLQLREFSASLCLCSGPGHTRGRGVAGHAEELEGHLK